MPRGGPEAAARTVQRRLDISRPALWQGLLWTLALIGLFMLPADYRAGAPDAHAHSLAQLWLDAADGAVHHHGHHPDRSALGDSASWFDPVVGATTTTATSPDVGDQHDSLTVSAEVQFLVVASELMLLAVLRGQALYSGAHRLHGRCPRVLSPPPRWTFAAA